MTSQDDLKAILDRIVAGTHTEADIAALSGALNVSGDRNVVQFGNYNVNIGKGRDIHVGDRIYQGKSAELIKIFIRQILAESPLNRQEYRLRNDLLVDVKSIIKRGLNDSLFNEEPINLLKEKRPDLVNPPKHRGVQTNRRSSFFLPPETSILNFFDREDITGKLLILGEPGSGKTVELLTLAEELITRAEADPIEPIPVLFYLSSWNNQKIEEWLVTELTTTLKHRISKQDGWELLKEHKLIPLLDGLDELGSERLPKCVSAINKFLDSEYRPKHLVVSARQRAYEQWGYPQLELNGAICLKPLNEKQIQEYLVRAERRELWQSIENEPSLLELARTPLFLFMIALVYEELELTQWRNFQSDKERHRYLFNAYITEKLEINPDKKRGLQRLFHRDYSPKKTRFWLSFIAERLEDESVNDFLIEKMQPTWLQTRKQKLLYRVLAGVISSVTSSVSIFPFSLVFGKIIFYIPPDALITNGLITGLKKEIKPIETLKLPWKEFIDDLTSKEIIYWIGFILCAGIISIALDSLLPMLSSIMVILIVSLLLEKFGDKIRGSEIIIEKKIVPNQGMRNTKKNTFILSIICGLISAVIGGIVFSQKSGELDTERFPLIFKTPGFQLIIEDISGKLGINQTTLLAIIIFWSYGTIYGGVIPGVACIQHFTLRLILWWNRYIPWNYTHFLDYATERKFLQRVGGRYRFIHDLLREHFAQMEQK